MGRNLIALIALLTGLINYGQNANLVQSYNINRTHTFNKLGVNDGLSQNSVISIAQDSTGYLWVATQDGLNRYDGHQIKYYDRQFEDVTRPTYSRLGKVHVDNKGRLFIVSVSGKLEIYDIAEDSFKEIEGIDDVSTIFETENGEFLIGTFSKGLFRIKIFEHRIVSKSVVFKTSSQINDILQYDQNIYLTTQDGLYKAPLELQRKFESVSKNNAPANFGDLLVAHNELLIATHGQGIWQLSLTTGGIAPFLPDLLPSNLNVQDMMVAEDGNLWIATYGDGAFVVNSDWTTAYNYSYEKHNPNSLSYNDVLTLFQDQAGTVWLGTDGGGASYYDPYLSKFQVLTNQQLNENVNLDVVRAIATDSEGTIWVGTSGKGLTMIPKKGDPKTFTLQNSNLASNRIMALYYNDNILYIGHQGAGLQFKNTNDDFINLKDSGKSQLNNNTIWHITANNNNHLLLATRESGLFEIDKEGNIIYQYNSKTSALGSDNIRITCNDSRNNLWIGTEDSGLYVLNTSTDKIEKIDQIHDKIKSLYIDNANNQLWIGTNGDGLIQFDIGNQQIIEIYTQENGLPNDVIYGLLPEESNALWMTTNKGLARLDLHSKEFQNYTNYDGLQGLEFNTGAYHKDANGNLYFGGLNGINWFNPKDIHLNPIVPKTIITGFHSFGQPHNINGQPNLKHNNNTVTFQFSSLHFSQPERTQYAYILEDYDQDWTVGYKNEATYTKLPPGDYVFYVRSSNYDGIWNEVPASIKFSIGKPWYTSTPAYIFYGLLLATLIYFVYDYFKARWQFQMKLAVEHSESERLKHLNKFKTKLYTNIAHELRTPLTLIKGPLENQMNRPSDDEYRNKDLSLILQSTNRLMTLADQMSDLAVVDSGELKLNCSFCNLSGLLHQITDAFDYLANERNITLVHDIDLMTEIPFDGDIIEKIVTNLLSNAIKYAPQDTTVRIVAKRMDNSIILNVINQHPTLGKKHLHHLFQRFYQDDKSSEGMGVGLALVKELVELHNGQIVANNLNDNTIQFSVSIPVLKAEGMPKKDGDSKKVEAVFSSSAAGVDVLQNSVLVVEDNDDVRRFIKSILKDEYRVFEVNDGQQALAFIEKRLPDLIVSDVMMPHIDGLQLCKHVRQNPVMAHIPFLLLSAKAGENNIIEGIDLGADDYLPKPFSPTLLKTKLRNLMQRQGRLKAYYDNLFTIQPELEINSAERSFATRLKSVVEKYITNSNFTADHFCELMGVSRSHLHRKIKALSGLSTTGFIRKQRLNLAANLLVEQADLDISEIAYSLGFNSPGYFVKCFKKEFKETPSDYRNSQVNHS